MSYPMSRICVTSWIWKCWDVDDDWHRVSGRRQQGFAIILYVEAGQTYGYRVDRAVPGARSVSRSAESNARPVWPCHCPACVLCGAKASLFRRGKS